MKPIVFSPIKELTISHPLVEADEEECMDAIVELARSQYAKRVPFERVTVRARAFPTRMEEKLRQWVNVVSCYQEDPSTVDD